MAPLDLQRPSLRRRFYRPHEAADALGTDVEAIRQGVLHFDGEPERIPLFLETKSSMRVFWVPCELIEQHIERGVMGRSERRINPATGQHELWDVTDGVPGNRLSTEFDVGAGLWFELDPEHCNDLAADPDAPITVHWLRADRLGIGPIPGNALICVFDAPPTLTFADCWIAAGDVERLLPALPPPARPLGGDLPGTLEEWEAAPWASKQLKAAIGGSLTWAGLWERGDGDLSGGPDRDEMAGRLQEDYDLSETAAKRVAAVIRPDIAPKGRPAGK